MGSKLSKREKTLVLMVFVAAIVFVYYQYFLSPLLAEVSFIKEEMVESEERLGEIKQTDSRISILLSEIEELKSGIREQEVLIPAAPKTPGIINQLEAYSEAAGVVLAGMDFDIVTETKNEQEDEKKDSGYLEVPVQIFISGPYESILSFLEALEGSERLYNITDFDLYAAQSEDGNSLDMSIDLCAYVLKQEGEPAGEPETYDFMEQEYGRDNPFQPVTH